MCNIVILAAPGRAPYIRLMRKSFGILMTLVVMAVVLLLVAEAWKKFGPAAISVQQATEGEGPVVVPDHGETGAGQALRQGKLPRVHEMRKRTDAHSEDVQKALATE